MALSAEALVRLRLLTASVQAQPAGDLDGALSQRLTLALMRAAMVFADRLRRIDAQSRPVCRAARQLFWVALIFFFHF